MNDLEHDTHLVALRRDVIELETRLKEAKYKLAAAEDFARKRSSKSWDGVTSLSREPDEQLATGVKNGADIRPVEVSFKNYDWQWPLAAEEYTRYGRQMIMPEIGLQGQLKLRKASILIVGLGGLGCPAAQYLAGAGIGTIGMVDGDTVELSNLHRQILHNTARVGQLKVESAEKGLRQLNPSVNYKIYTSHLSSKTALDIMKNYDLVLDCTDHPSSRYLVSDAAVFSGIPLVTASALRTDGQMMVLNYPTSSSDGQSGGPCYRCIFPKPPPVESVISCGEGGILGPVVGVMGVLMALEAIKLITKQLPPTPALSEKPKAVMHIFSAFGNPLFRQVTLRGKRSNCQSCIGDFSTKKLLFEQGSMDYSNFCGVSRPITTLTQNERIGAKDFHELVSQRPNNPYFLIDVRDSTQYGICKLDGGINIPYSILESLPLLEKGPSSTEKYTVNNVPSDMKPLYSFLSLISEEDSAYTNTPIYTVCRFGNDSQLAVQKLKELGYDHGGNRWIGDIKGGLRAWKNEVDPTWPEY